MKFILIFTLSLFPSISFASNNYDLAFENDELLLILNLKCSPCDISCATIQYQLFNKEKQSTVSGRARTVTAGLNHNFRGYIIHNRNTFYTLTESNNENMWNITIEEKDVQHPLETVKIDKYQIKTIFDNGTC